MPDAPRRTTHRTGRNGLLLTLPLLAFILVFFAAPIGAMLWRSVSNPLPAAMLPKTAEALAGWDAQALPGEAAYAAIVEDLKALKREEAAKLGAQLNFDFGGLNSLIRKTAREAAKLAPPYADSLPKLDKQWANQAVWAAIAVGTQSLSAKNYLAAVDLRYGADLSVERVADKDAIYLMLFGRTAWVAALVTVLCLILGYPLAWLLANAGPRTAGLLMILLLLPFWTSLLVRTTAWIALLQSQGVVNDMLVWLGLVDDRSRVQLVYNMTGTLVAMTQVKISDRAKLELARNYWDEMGRGSARGMHGPMLTRTTAMLGLTPTIDATLWQSLCLANTMTAFATTRRYVWHSIGALGVVELTAPTRVACVDAGLKRVGVPPEA